jgi:hypothetical protein
MGLVDGDGDKSIKRKHTLRPTNGPVQSKMRLKYRAPTLRVEIMRTAPPSATRIGTMMCQQCSPSRPEDHDMTSVAKYAITYGGA